MQRETYRQGIRQKQQKLFNEKIKPASKCRLHWKLQNAAKMKVDLFPRSIFLVDFFLREKEQSALNSHLWVIAAFNQLLHSQHHRPTILSVSLLLFHYCISLYQSYIIYQATTIQQHCQCRWHQHQLLHYHRHIHISLWCTVRGWSDENVWRL